MKYGYRYILVVLLLQAVVADAFGQGTFVSSFNVEVRQKSAYLRWTISEGNICYGIVISRSLDQINYERVGEIFGVCGSTDTAQKYSFVDESPIENKENYYRLEFGGHSSVAVESVFLIGESTLIVSPNPVSDKLRVRFSNAQGGLGSLVVIDVSGNIVQTTETKGETIEIDASGLPAGVYIYAFHLSEQIRYGRFSVVH